MKNKPERPALSMIARGTARCASCVSFASVAADSKPTKLNTANASAAVTPPNGSCVMVNCTGSTTVPRCTTTKTVIRTIMDSEMPSRTSARRDDSLMSR